jgi:hypothetical protein
VSLTLISAGFEAIPYGTMRQFKRQLTYKLQFKIVSNRGYQTGSQWILRCLEQEGQMRLEDGHQLDQKFVCFGDSGAHLQAGSGMVDR